MKKIILVLSALILACLACAMPRIKLPGKSGDPTVTQPVIIPPVEAPATDLPSIPTEAQGDVIFSDNFDNPASSTWDSTSSDTTSVTYEDGRFVMAVTASNELLRTYSNRVNTSDVSIEVDIYNLYATEDHFQGVLCRVQDYKNFYYFAFDTNGYVIIYKTVNGKSTKLYGGYVDKSITSGGQNHLRADCIGSTLTLYVNGQQVATVDDTSLSNSGDVGLFTYSYDTVPVRIAYDNFVVREIR